MSGYKVHMAAFLVFVPVFLLLLYGVFGFLPSPVSLFLGVLSGVFYSVLPDMDIRGSKIRWFLGVLFFVSATAFYLSNVVFFALFSFCVFLFLLVTFFMKHRGFLHSFLACVLFSGPLFFFDPFVGLLSFLGFLCHLACDGKLFKMF